MKYICILSLLTLLLVGCSNRDHIDDTSQNVVQEENLISVDYIVNNINELQDTINTALPGSTVAITELESVVTEKIIISKPITLIGGSNTNVTSYSDTLFEITPGTVDVTFSNMSVKLESGKFISAHDVKGVTVQYCNIEGNIFNDDKSYIAIHITDSDDIEIKYTNVSKNYGGFYLNNSNNTRLLYNTLNNVTFGNIAVSGFDIIIKGNTINKPGVEPSIRPDPNGDAITLGLVNNVEIEGNTVTNGNCYGIYAYTNDSKNITIKNNSFTGGNTSAIHFVNIEDVIIESNKFENNIGAGVSFFPVRNGQVKYNTFIDDEFRIYSLSSNIDLIGNKFTLPINEAVLHSVDFVDGVNENNIYNYVNMY